MYSWGLASLMTVALYVIEAIYKRGDVIGDATYECWIGPTYKDLRVNLFYIPLWIHFFLIVGLYTHIFIRVSSVWQIVNEQNIHANIIPAFPSIREEENGHDKSISQDQNHEKESSYVASGIGNQLSVPASATEIPNPNWKRTSVIQHNHS
ncbi:hypothetical protein BCR33DRAFT_846532 [Rhizoclosmatium globosum]|uniref:G-protein coupled receptors family 2 profile 2 domain-containing protein n=1 Tax=Rhizoclosmatium globosum TaxID=329046 RepID=A0A1Y2CVB9_9FUNG|nr:hypothetical protein BCR33DRAFT_846532 [Rhizoclosmatium globosum]|eukprot:ORY50836.1 hypothetical protein BCR33DRAFT_846532 [Rhizoclosmatium globosum]